MLRRLLPAVIAVGVLTGAVASVLAGPALHAGGSVLDVDGTVIGTVRLVEDATGRVHVNVHVDGLTPGRHGIHIHAVGACEPTFAAAGPHFNPGARQHGLANPAGAHAGDLPNLEVSPAGVGHLDTTTDRVTLSGGPATLFDADGSAFIIHANPDDQVTDATNGGSGARVACAVVVAG
jgi:Cu-Zn family superoxide dismutase